MPPIPPIPPPPGGMPAPPWFFFGTSATMASVVIRRAATEAAFWIATRTTLVGSMMPFVEQADRGQWTLLPECLDHFIDEGNPVRVIDVFVDALDLAEMSFEGVSRQLGWVKSQVTAPGRQRIRAVRRRRADLHPRVRSLPIGIVP